MFKNSYDNQAYPLQRLIQSSKQETGSTIYKENCDILRNLGYNEALINQIIPEKITEKAKCTIPKTLIAAINQHHHLLINMGYTHEQIAELKTPQRIERLKESHPRLVQIGFSHPEIISIFKKSEWYQDLLVLNHTESQNAVRQLSPQTVLLEYLGSDENRNKFKDYCSKLFNILQIQSRNIQTSGNTDTSSILKTRLNIKEQIEKLLQFLYLKLRQTQFALKNSEVGVNVLNIITFLYKEFSNQTDFKSLNYNLEQSFLTIELIIENMLASGFTLEMIKHIASMEKGFYRCLRLAICCTPNTFEQFKISSQNFKQMSNELDDLLSQELNNLNFKFSYYKNSIPGARLRLFGNKFCIVDESPSQSATINQSNNK